MRWLLSAALALLVLAAPSAGLAQGDAPPVRARNAGVIAGRVVGIDYRTGIADVATRNRGRFEVQILPSTIIEGPTPGFHTITDIAKGSRIRVFLSQRGNLFNAQIVRIK